MLSGQQMLKSWFGATLSPLNVLVVVTQCLKLEVGTPCGEHLELMTDHLNSWFYSPKNRPPRWRSTWHDAGNNRRSPVPITLGPTCQPSQLASTLKIWTYEQQQWRGGAYVSMVTDSCLPSSADKTALHMSEYVSKVRFVEWLLAYFIWPRTWFVK